MAQANDGRLRIRLIICLAMMGFNADDFLLVRNPAIKIIGKRNEREGGSTISSTGSNRPQVSAEPTAAPRNQDSTGAGASSPSSLPPPSPANEKPEPRLATTSTAALAPAAAAVVADVPQQAPESSQLWSSKEEASSRLEALLKNTAPHSSAADKNDRRLQQHDLKNHRGLCHLVKFEATRPQKHQQQHPPLPLSKSRLPRPVVDLVDPVVEQKSVQHCKSTDDLTDLWSETHKNSYKEDASGQEKAGKRYRSSIRIMVRPEAVQQLQKPIRANSSDGLSRSTSTSSEAARSAKKLSAAGVRAAPLLSELERPTTRPIVKEQFR